MTIKKYYQDGKVGQRGFDTKDEAIIYEENKELLDFLPIYEFDIDILKYIDVKLVEADMKQRYSSKSTKIKCNDCGSEYPITKKIIIKELGCPNCGNDEFKVVK